MNSYKFSLTTTNEETGETTTTSVEFDTLQETWSGSSGPMCKFYDFLRGCGYIFPTESEIGIMTEEGFIPAWREPFFGE